MTNVIIQWLIIVKKTYNFSWLQYIFSSTVFNKFIRYIIYRLTTKCINNEDFGVNCVNKWILLLFILCK